MARTIDAKCKQCRREGIKLFLKGSRCESPKCAIERRNISPGMHWHRRSKLSEYGIRLREKQKLKRFYGVYEGSSGATSRWRRARRRTPASSS